MTLQGAVAVVQTVVVAVGKLEVAPPPRVEPRQLADELGNSTPATTTTTTTTTTTVKVIFFPASVKSEYNLRRYTGLVYKVVPNQLRD